MDALNRRRNTLVAGAALVLFASVYYSLIYRYGLNLADEGNVALISQRLIAWRTPFPKRISWLQRALVLPDQYPIQAFWHQSASDADLFLWYIDRLRPYRLYAPSEVGCSSLARVRPRFGCDFGHRPIFQGVHTVPCDLESVRDHTLLDEPTKGSSKRRRRASARDHLSDPHRHRDISHRDLVRRHFAARSSARSPAPLEFDCCGQFLPRRRSHAPSLYLRCLSSAFLAAVRRPILEYRGPHLETYTTAPRPKQSAKNQDQTGVAHGPATAATTIENHSCNGQQIRRLSFVAVRSNKYF